MCLNEKQGYLQIGWFEAGCNRIGDITIEADEKCDICDETTTVLAIDSSEGEYGSGCACLDCIKNGFNAFDNSLRGETDGVTRKREEVERRKEEQIERWREETRKWNEKHLTYCNDKRCTALCHEWNKIEYLGIGKKLLVADDTDEWKKAIADSFYVTPDPDEES